MQNTIGIFPGFPEYICANVECLEDSVEIVKHRQPHGEPEDVYSIGIQCTTCDNCVDTNEDNDGGNFESVAEKMWLDQQDVLAGEQNARMSAKCIKYLADEKHLILCAGLKAMEDEHPKEFNELQENMNLLMFYF